MINAETIQRNFSIFRTRITAPSGTAEEILPPPEEPLATVVIEQPAQERAPQQTTPEQPALPAASPQTEPARTEPVQPAQPSAPVPAQTREMVVFFTNVGNDGQILQSRVTRRIPVSETPMQDALNALLAGPAADEVGRGILNLIPRNTRVLSAIVRGNTAYISFSEDFLFNTFGVEGYVAQLRQIIWTVTEFQNINDVQILIEGRRMDYLGEGIWIGSPISRQSF